MPFACGRIAGIVTLVLLLPGVAYPQQVDVHTLIDDAVVAGRWQQVIELLEPRLAEAPDEAVSYWYGVARYELGDPGGAVGHLNRALELRPDSIPTARYLARCAVDMKASATAVALAKRFPTDAQITFSAGRALIEEYSRTDIRDRSGFPFHQMDAVKWLRASTLIDGESVEVYRWLAFAYKMGDAWERALMSINQAIALGPAGWEAYAFAGECYEKLDAHEQAAQAYLRASELAPQPQRADLLFRRGEMLSKAGLHHEAVQAYKRVLVLDFGHRVVRFRLGEAALNAKDYYLALWAFKESRELDGNTDSLVGVGRCQYELGNYEDAERLIAQAIEEAKSHGFTSPVIWRHYLGRAQLRLDKREEANETLVKAFNARPGNLIYGRWAFKSYMMTDDPYGAIEVCQEIADRGYPDVAVDGIKHVLRTWPEPRLGDGHRRPHTDVAATVMVKIAYRAQQFRAAAGLYRELGRVERKYTHLNDAVVAGRWQQVIELLEPRLAEAPDEAVSYWYGVARYELGDPGGAIEHLKLALVLSPDSIPTARYLARCAVDMKDSAAAVALAKRFPTDAQITFNAGKVLIQLYSRSSARDPSGSIFNQIDAVKWLRTSTLIDGESAEAYRWLAFAHKEAYGWERALRNINQAIALGPAGWEAYTLAGECYEKLDAYEQAAQAYLSASELAPQPQRVVLLFTRGEMLNKAGLHHEAIEAYKRVMVLDFGHRVVRYRLGEAALNAKDYYLALWAFKESREVDGNIDSLFGVGRCQYELGNYEDAERLIAQAIEETKSHGFTNPVKWRHYLGRAQLRLGKHEEANKTLVKAFNVRPGNLIYARWAFKSYMMTDDPYGAIGVCQEIADQGYPDVAVDGIKHVMKTWPTPRFRDFGAEHRRPHTDVAAMAMVKIAYRAQRFRAAVGLFRALGRLEGRRTHVDAGWARLAAGDLQGALTSFGNYSLYCIPEWRKYGYLGGATTLILQGKAETADKALSTIKYTGLVASQEACKLWARAATGRGVKRSQADPFTMLGVVGWVFVDRQGKTGLEIRAILPGSLLDRSPVKVRPMDVLIQVDYHRVNGFGGLAKLRSKSLPKEPVTVVLRRGSQVFKIEVDFADALAKLPQPDKPDEPDAVEKGADD